MEEHSSSRCRSVDSLLMKEKIDMTSLEGSQSVNEVGTTSPSGPLPMP